MKKANDLEVHSTDCSIKKRSGRQLLYSNSGISSPKLPWLKIFRRLAHSAEKRGFFKENAIVSRKLASTVTRSEFY